MYTCTCYAVIFFLIISEAHAVQWIIFSCFSYSKLHLKSCHNMVSCTTQEYYNLSYNSYLMIA